MYIVLEDGIYGPVVERLLILAAETVLPSYPSAMTKKIVLSAPLNISFHIHS